MKDLFMCVFIDTDNMSVVHLFLHIAYSVTLSWLRFAPHNFF